MGMLMHVFVPGIYDVRLETSGEFFRSLGLGLVALLVTPCAVVLCGLTLVGLPVALIALGLYLGGIYVSGIVVSSLVGSALVKPRGENWTAFGLTLLVGLIAVLVVTNLPFVGSLILFLVIAAGVGLLIQRGHSAWRGSATR